jgi:hypothetical protein
MGFADDAGPGSACLLHERIDLCLVADVVSQGEHRGAQRRLRHAGVMRDVRERPLAAVLPHGAARPDRRILFQQDGKELNTVETTLSIGIRS